MALAQEVLVQPIVQVCVALLVNTFVIIQIRVNITCLKSNSFLVRG